MTKAGEPETNTDGGASASFEPIPYDDVPPHINRMWQVLGWHLQLLALRRGAEAETASDARAAAEIARIAEGCFWQGMGDADCFDLKKLLSPLTESNTVKP